MNARIEVFADIWCPFAYVGLRRLFDERDVRRIDDLSIHVRSWPLEWVNRAPMDPMKARANATALREQLVPDMFANVNTETFPRTTLPALDFIAQAYMKSMPLGERASLAVREALFEQGLDVSQDKVIRSIAHDLGVTYSPDPAHSSVLKDWEEGQRRGVIGSPHFFKGEHDQFCPSLDLTRDEDSRLHVQANVDKLIDFLTSS